MLTRLIVNVYPWLIELSLWFALLASSVTGYYYTGPLLHAAGLIPAQQMAWGIAGAIVFASLSFLVMAVAAGPLLMLVDIRRLVSAIESSGRINGNQVPLPDLRNLREPRI
jgi:hypothetical protein